MCGRSGLAAGAMVLRLMMVIRHLSYLFRWVCSARVHRFRPVLDIDRNWTESNVLRGLTAYDL